MSESARGRFVDWLNHELVVSGVIATGGATLREKLDELTETWEVAQRSLGGVGSGPFYIRTEAEK